MNIEVTDYTQTSSWLAFFELLSNKKFAPLWETLGFPPGTVSRPDPIVNVAKDFIGTLTLPKEEDNPYKASLEDVVESLRLDLLSRLALTFAKVIDHYGLESAEEQYSIADHTFLHPKCRFWGIWFNLFTGGIQVDFPLGEFLRTEEQMRLENSINHHLLTLKNQTEFAATISDEYLEEHPTIHPALERSCAKGIWDEVRSVCDEDVRENLYEWGFKNVDHLMTTEEWESMKPYCLSDSINQTEN